MAKKDESKLKQWFQGVYAENYKIIHRYAKIIIDYHCPALRRDLDDLVQETFFILYKKRRKLYRHENITGWLIVALKYAFNNRRRKIERHLEVLLDKHATESIHSPTNPVEQALFGRNPETLKLIRLAIDDEQKYQAFIDFHVHRISIRTLAQKYGKSESAMKVQLYRCKKLCQALFEKSYNIDLLIFLFCVTFWRLKT